MSLGWDWWEPGNKFLKSTTKNSKNHFAHGNILASKITSTVKLKQVYAQN